MATIKRFEEALGRRALRPVPHAVSQQWQYMPRLRIYPHALREVNFYYSPAKKLFKLSQNVLLLWRPLVEASLLLSPGRSPTRESCIDKRSRTF